MKIKNFYPVDFDGSRKAFNSLLRTLLIKANYDAVLKKVTAYKGMHQYNDSQECWTLKFEGKEGVYGLIQNQNIENENSFEACFDIYYFPSPNEKDIQNSSLIEEYIANSEQFIEKVKGFSSFLELFLNFKIAKLDINIHKEQDKLQITYKTLNRIKTFSKDGIEDLHNHTKERYIISPKSIDKNFPSFKFILPFFNFFNTLLTRSAKKDPINFNIRKSKVEAIYYDKEGVQSKNNDSLCTKLELTIEYSNEEKSVIKNTKYKRIFDILSSGSWFKYDLDLSKFTSIQNKSLKPRLIVVTGFLGSGKTNFLQNFIEFENQNNKFVGIIQNEIGKTGLDGKLLDYDFNIVEIDEGCVCCSLAGQLRAAVTTLIQKKIPDTIILETTGVANPFNLLSEIDELNDLIDFDSIITVVDAKSYSQLIQAYSVFKDQIRSADVILLNKIDLLDEKELKEIEEKLHIQNRCANIIKTIQCNINPLVVTNSAQLSNNTSHISGEFNEETTHFRTHKDDNLSSIKKIISKKLNRKVFEEFLQNIPKNILRVKGIVEFENSTSQFVVQYVNNFYEIIELEENKKREKFLIYIGEKIQEKFDIFM
ncbi:MAG: cobalamin biosynthesis protein P47K [Arcobacter sp.]|nr:cobalamin biosynthesis protein P47K [Arcobacter sp.]|tara:strand:+ start:27755 stop:29536 length:1782 start_codon:yes stop_codon:yes gene_type:complete